MIIEKMSEFTSFMKVCYRLLGGHRKPYVIFIVLSIMAALTEGVGVAMMAPILESQAGVEKFSNVPLLGFVSSYFGGLDPVTKLQAVAVTLAFVLVVRGALLYWVAVLGGVIPLNLQRKLYARGYEALLRAEYSYFTEKTTGDHANSLVDWVLRVTAVLVNVAVAINGIFLFIVYLILMLSLSWKMALIGGICAVTMSKILKTFSDKVLRRTGAELSEKMGKVSEMIFETISGMKFIKTSAAENVMSKRYETVLDDKISLDKTMVMYQSATSPFLTTFSGLVICGLLFVGPYINEGGDEWVGGLLLFLFLMMRLLAPVTQISGASMQISSHAFALERLELFFKETEVRKQFSGAMALDKIKNEIVFDNVSFHYSNSGEKAIHNLSMKMPAGKMVAVVGPSGAGKSTLVSLLTRFYDPQNGKISIDGIDLKDLDVYDLRRKISVVSQDIFIFNDTVKNNLTFATEGLTDEDVVRAAKLAAADEFIQALPEGYDTKLGDRGVRLSGGQQQRIAIARAILCDAELLIFDEATSHLDTYTEQAIQDAVEELRKDRTVLVIAHRLSTIRRADSVIVLKEGKAIEDGTHNKLMAAKGEYWDMVIHQNLELVNEDDTDLEIIETQVALEEQK